MGKPKRYVTPMADRHALHRWDTGTHREVKGLYHVHEKAAALEADDNRRA